MKLTLLLIVLLAATPSFAEDKKPVEPAKPAEAGAEPKVYAPTELEALKAQKGKKILVEGTIALTGSNKADTIRYLNFTKNYRESVALVFFAKDGGGTFTKEKLSEYVGKKVRVNGELTEFNGALQIKVESFDQIKVLSSDPAK